MNIRLSAVLAVLLAAPVAAMAQNAPAPAGTTSADAPSPHAGRGGMMMRALAGLGLSDDQQSKIRAIVQAGRAKNRGVTDPDTRRANARDMRSQVEAVLTDTQLVQLKRELKEMRAERRANAGAPAATPAP